MLRKTPSQTRLPYWSSYLTSFLDIAPAFAGLFLLTVLLTACQGYTPPAPTQATQTRSAPTRTFIPRVTLAPGFTPAPTKTHAPVSTLAVDREEIQGVTVQFWRASNQSHLQTEDLLGTLVEEFNRQNDWGIRVETTVYEDYTQIFDSLQTTFYGNLPNLVMGYNFQAARVDHAGGALVDLSDYVYDPVWGFTQDEIDDFYPVYWDQDLYGDKRLGIPFYRTGQLLYYNQTWAKELGFDAPPATPRELLTQVCKAAQAHRQKDEGGTEGTGGLAIDTSTPTLLAWIYAFGGEVTRLDDKGYNFDSDDARDAFVFIRDLYDRGCAWFAPSRYPNQEFAARQSLLISGSLTGLPAQVEAIRESRSSDRWLVIPFPSGAGQPVIVTHGPSFSILQSTGKEQLAAWLVVKWLTAPENQARWSRSYDTFPSRLSANDHLDEYAAGRPQWAAALELIPYTRVEPSYASWRVVRWALGDAGSYLFSQDFTLGQVKDLLKEMDATAAELHNQLGR